MYIEVNGYDETKMILRGKQVKYKITYVIPDLSEGQEGYIVQERPQLSVKTSADRGGEKKVRRKIQKGRTGPRR